MRKNYYDTLGVNKSASDKEIKSAYKKLSKKYHPDVSTETDAETKFKEISEAYSILGDSNKRRQYDNDNEDGYNPFGGNPFGGNPFDFGDIYSDIFNSPRYKNTANLNLRINLSVTLDEVNTGVNKTIKYNRKSECISCEGQGGSDKKTCMSCNGTGKKKTVTRTIMGNIISERLCDNCGGRGSIIHDVCNTCGGEGQIDKSERINIDIPRGVNKRTTFKYSNKGNFYDGNYGDLIVDINIVCNNTKFNMNGVDLITTQHVPINYLMLGKKFIFEGLNGEKSEIKIPDNSRPGTILRLIGKGIYQGDKRHDIYIKLDIMYPSSISEDERRILEQLDGKENFSI